VSPSSCHTSTSGTVNVVNETARKKFLLLVNALDAF
jgi:hypothetical protein